MSRVQFRPGWLADSDLRQWLSAVDVVVFNYQAIFTSGAACLARSYGVPILLPTRLRTVALDEPSTLVQRFDDLGENFRARLESAFAVPPDYEAAAGWRATTAWSRIAELTDAAYRDALRLAGIQSSVH